MKKTIPHAFVLIIDRTEIVAACTGGEDYGHIAHLCWWQRELGARVHEDDLEFARLEYQLHHATEAPA